MKKNLKKWLCVVLAVLVLLPTVPLIAGAIAPPENSTENVASSAQSPLKVEITTGKDKYTLLGKIEFTATITNTSNSAVNNVRAEVQFGKDLRPLKGSQIILN